MLNTVPQENKSISKNKSGMRNLSHTAFYVVEPILRGFILFMGERWQNTLKPLKNDFRGILARFKHIAGLCVL